jgi:tripartite-type tricarboxylate transporter receptor subunit TctC
MSQIDTRRRNVLISGLTGAAAVLPRLAWAQRAAGPLRVLVGYPPGGATDVVARLVVRQMTGYETAIVDNKAGAGGRIALESLVRSKADGLTIVITPDFPLTVFPHLYPKLGYDPLKDLVPVAACAVSELAVCVGPAVPAEVTTLAGFLQWARRNPKQALYASPSPGSPPHFTGVMLASASRTELTHVAYKGGSQAIQDLLGGQVPASINPVGEVLPYLSSGKLRVLASTGPQRSRFVPDAPTLVESGYPDLVVQAWIGVFAPTGTPGPAIAGLEHSVQEAIKSEAVADGFAKFGMSVATLPPSRFAALVRDDLQRWGPVVKASGFTVNE